MMVQKFGKKKERIFPANSLSLRTYEKEPQKGSGGGGKKSGNTQKSQKNFGLSPFKMQ